MTPPDEHGFCSLGTSVDAMLSAVRNAKSVIVQFNKSMPRTLGDSFVHISKIDYAVEVDQPPYDHNPGNAGEVELKIGAFVADLVQDEATLQMGIGAIPSAVGKLLYDKKNLGVHTEMFTDILVDLVERGVVTCEAKEVNCGKIVTSFMMGTQRLYKFVDNNPMVEMRPVDYTNDTSIIRRHRRMTAINSAIEVDLTGQVCADSIGHRMYSGVGGQMDFMRGAAPGRGGPGDHRPAVHRGRRQGLADHHRPQGGCGRNHDPFSRPDGRDGVRRGRALRPEPARAGQAPDRDRPPRLPRRADGLREEVPRAVAARGLPAVVAQPG